MSWLGLKGLVVVVVVVVEEHESQTSREGQKVSGILILRTPL
jgi:hypothetical protein